MSPHWDGCVFEAGGRGGQRDAAAKVPLNVHLGAGKTEAASLLGNLETAAFPLHDVVVADDALVHEAADALKIFWSGPPRGGLFARLPGKAAVVVGDELAQHGVGGGDVGSLGQAQ